MQRLFSLIVVTAFLAGSMGLAQSLLADIQARGNIVCGVNQNLPGFGSVDEAGEFVGFDVDFCKAIAAAVLGDASAVEYRPLSASERPTALQSGEIDVLIRNTTWTSSRDSDWGNFTATTFYDGQGFLVRKDSGIFSLDDLDGTTVCVQSGTTTELNLADTMAANDIDYTPLNFEDLNQLVQSYEDGACEAFTADKSGLLSRQATLRSPDEHTVLEATISKEPLGPVVPHGDDAWFDVVKWTIFALMFAEEVGIDSSNVEEMSMASEDPNVKRFLGTDPDNVEGLGLSADAFKQAILQVGNYAEIYNRNLGPDTVFDVPRGLNALYTEGGLLYPPPFR